MAAAQAEEMTRALEQQEHEDKLMRRGLAEQAEAKSTALADAEELVVAAEEQVAVESQRAAMAEAKAAAAEHAEQRAVELAGAKEAEAETKSEKVRVMSVDLEEARNRMQAAEVELVTERAVNRSATDKLFAVQSEVARLQQRVGRIMALEEQLQRYYWYYWYCAHTTAHTLSPPPHARTSTLSHTLAHSRTLLPSCVLTTRASQGNGTGGL
jgi:hypothetical protein